MEGRDPPTLGVPGYSIVERLVADDRWTIHRGRRRDDGRPVLLKLPNHEVPSAGDLELFAREATLVRELDVPGVPRVLDFLRYDLRCALVVEDGGAVPLAGWLASGPLDLSGFFRLAVELVTILAELHRCGVIHGNITPRSILVHPSTTEVNLADFQLASRASSETTTPLPPRLLRGTLAYLSPEQTGRMNRVVDYRADFYSLGVTFYELLTGKLPFRSDDALELIHWHIAKTPPAPADLDQRIPEPVSAIVMKLLAKTAEQRYQSALGLKEDLERCSRDWSTQRRVAAFPLAQRDVSDRFLIAQKLYGREREVSELLMAFDRVCEGKAPPASMMLVTGYSGIGKTSLIQELYRPIVRERGYFISGKFDQIVRSVPFGGLIQAFRELVRQFLTESEEQLSFWRTRLSEALGSNGGVLAEVIPEVELIVGKQPVPVSLGATEAFNRFQLVFEKFVGALARKEHPLVLFLDDLQWADAATLSLLRPLLSSASTQFLFLMGAYRDNEVDAGHPLMRTLVTLEAAGGKLYRVTLGPLEPADLVLFLRDTLHGECSDAEPLARLVYQKTGGNPFFAIEFLKMLHQERLLRFDYGEGRWTYRLEEIARTVVTDGVVDLMARKIQRLPPRTQHTLTLAACIGNPFDEQTLATVSEQSPAATAHDLEEALDAGLILRMPTTYRPTTAGTSGASTTLTYTFLHDRVQQAAYALIPPDRKQVVHLTVGRLLQKREEPLAETLFDVVQHLNLGRRLITDEHERKALLRLNLRAGQKAKSKTAYDAALGYFEAAAHVSREAEWETDYDLLFSVHLESAECHILCGNFDEAAGALAVLLTRARTSLDQAKVHSLRIIRYENLSCYADAIKSAREGLALFGVSFPESLSAKETALEQELTSIHELLASRAIASLVDLPRMSDPEIRMVMSILMTIWSCAYISGDGPLTRLLSATMVRLSLTHGNCEESAYGYATHAITVGPLREDYEAAYEFGSLAMRVNERMGDSKRRAKICQQFQAHAVLWRRPLRDCVTYAREASRSGFETGDLNYAIYGAYTETWSAIAIAQDLAQFVRDYSPNLALFKKLKVASIGDGQRALLNWAEALQGKTRSPLSLSTDDFDESQYLAKYGGNPFFAVCYAVAKLHLGFLLGDHSQALEAGAMGGRLIHHLAGTIWPVVYDFWHCLTLAATFEDATDGERQASLEEMRRVDAKFLLLADNCPENYRCQSLLLSAEIARVNGDQLKCIGLYERAIDYAAETHMLQYQALANELSARLWLVRDQKNVATAFLNDARACYAAWGAAAKVVEINQRYTTLLGHHAIPGTGAVPERAAAGLALPETGELDLFSVAKAAQAIGGELDLQRLLGKLMHIAIENAGAERCCLTLEHDGESFLHAEGSLGNATVKVLGGIHLTEADGVAASIVNYVRRTMETVVLVDARTDDRYSGDRYILRAQPRSVMCIPVQSHGRLIGALYLENNQASGAFTPGRIQICSMLASQAAISLENARLYEDMKREVVRRRKAEDDLRSALVEVESLKNRLHAENVYLQEEIRSEHNFEEMVGQSPALIEALRKVEMVAATDSTVLIVGETGTGKELIARAIHNRSARADRPLVKVNCGAITAGLVESELFGHVKGAFTGAIEKRVGRFELANGGTLFLDELGELSPETQVKLLRVLQEKEFEPVGSNRTIRVDVRVIGATNRNLTNEVEAGRFRADLFYRLSVFPITVPPLRERKADIPRLASYFLSRFAREFGRDIDSIPRDTMEQLGHYAWPGNIRELSNVIERAVVLSSGKVLTLSPDILPIRATAFESARASEAGNGHRSSLEEVERNHILTVLHQVGWIIEGPKGAAARLNLHPNTLRSRLKKLGIRRPVDSSS